MVLLILALLLVEKLLPYGLVDVAIETSLLEGPMVSEVCVFNNIFAYDGIITYLCV